MHRTDRQAQRADSRVAAQRASDHTWRSTGRHPAVRSADSRVNRHSGEPPGQHLLRLLQRHGRHKRSTLRHLKSLGQRDDWTGSLERRHRGIGRRVATSADNVKGLTVGKEGTRERHAKGRRSTGFKDLRPQGQQRVSSAVGAARKANRKELVGRLGDVRVHVQQQGVRRERVARVGGAGSVGQRHAERQHRRSGECSAGERHGLFSLGGRGCRRDDRNVGRRDARPDKERFGHQDSVTKLERNRVATSLATDDGRTTRAKV
mmetsp:Transcript_1261/g.3938  ORF Transcript_1261/g.3938 Transcript_1261/m.3938 type:complete len:262 (+) Transcript_1261:867-1652(+)